LVCLLDVNVLVALAWPNHVHHASAHRWFDRNESAGWATCPLTETGFVRVSSNDRLFPEARSPREALDLLGRILALPHRVFWMDDTSIVGSRFVRRESLVGHRQLTDAHLLALALRRKGRLATFDRAVQDLVPPGIPADRAICVIPVV